MSASLALVSFLTAASYTLGYVVGRRRWLLDNPDTGWLPAERRRWRE